MEKAREEPIENIENIEDIDESDPYEVDEYLEGKPQDYIDEVIRLRKELDERYGEDEIEEYDEFIVFNIQRIFQLLVREDIETLMKIGIPKARELLRAEKYEEYANVILRLMEGKQKFLSKQIEAADDLFLDFDIFEESMDKLLSENPKKAEEMERIIYEVSPRYYIDVVKEEGKEESVTLDKIKEMYKEAIGIIKNCKIDFKVGEKEKSHVLLHYALDKVKELYGLELESDRLLKNRYEDQEYCKLYKELNDLYNST